MGQGQPTVEDNNANFATPSVFFATRRDIYRENVEGDLFNNSQKWSKIIKKVKVKVKGLI